MFGGPETTDWNGHGSWIGGNIAAALDGQGVNGIAPNIKLVALKISQWCGSAYDSTILDAFLYATDHHIDIVSISFGGYLDLRDPDQAMIWAQYLQVVERARNRGTLIVAAAGNEHVEIGTAGLVTSHGLLTNPATPVAFTDLFGLFEVPGGVPGVVDVSSTGNVVAASTPTARLIPPIQTITRSASPLPIAHQQTGVGLENQLAYYSNYGPRIDVAGPGGARKFNLPFWDNGGTPGFPYTTADLTTAFEDFSTTSNWALEIPCFVFSGGGFPADQCYSTIQGTSMATPHASGVLALIASQDPRRARPSESAGADPEELGARYPWQPDPGHERDRPLARRPDPYVPLLNGLLPPRWPGRLRRVRLRRRPGRRSTRRQALVSPRGADCAPGETPAGLPVGRPGGLRSADGGPC